MSYNATALRCHLLGCLRSSLQFAQRATEPCSMPTSRRVHRFWWHPAGHPIPEVGLLSLKCLSPRPQTIWSYDALSISTPGAIVADAGKLLNKSVTEAFVSEGVHLALLKDLISVLALLMKEVSFAIWIICRQDKPCLFLLPF